MSSSRLSENGSSKSRPSVRRQSEQWKPITIYSQNCLQKVLSEDFTVGAIIKSIFPKDTTTTHDVVDKHCCRYYWTISSAFCSHCSICLWITNSLDSLVPHTLLNYIFSTLSWCGHWSIHSPFIKRSIHYFSLCQLKHNNGTFCFMHCTDGMFQFNQTHTFMLIRCRCTSS